MKKYLLTTTAAWLMPAAVFAADLPARVSAPAPVPVFVAAPSWAGFYAGAIGSYVRFQSKVTDGGQYPIDEFETPTFSHRSSGGVAGLLVGYNWQFGNVVFGVEKDMSFGRISNRRFQNEPGGDTDDAIETKVNALGTLRARLGYAFSPNWMIYATGGLAAANFTQRAGDTDENSGVRYWDTEDSVLSLNKWRYGWALGAGVEAKFFRNWNVRLEYLYADFGSYRAFAQEPSYFSGDNVRRSGTFDNTVHMVRVGLTYQFNTAPATAPILARY